MFSVKRAGLIIFLANIYAFYLFFSRLTVLARTFSTMLNINGELKQDCLISNISKRLNAIPLSTLVVGCL